ncbi:lantibiotic dehydratase C-terminal domain-containing protein, partial [Streptomyces sp. NPDC032472]|uniref:lantibiotic dehydratase C-terminal domain-containing protein n=1 Tax=Streptomyces sp. NPDC032472 TaxID=3155018 RepID=UPI0033F82C25
MTDLANPSPSPVPSTPLATPPEAPAGGWQSLHLALHTGGVDTDAFVTGALAPLMDARYGPGAGAWFFIRHGEGGPHLRIRFRRTAADGGPQADAAGFGSPGAGAAGLAAELGRLAAGLTAAPGPRPGRHGEVRAADSRHGAAGAGGPPEVPV